MKTVKEEIIDRMLAYKTNIIHHPNVLAKDLMKLMNDVLMPSRLKRRNPPDLLL